MGIRLRDALMREMGTLRYEPTEKRIRGILGDATVIDSTRAMLVWEPQRIVPTYAVPVEDVDGEIRVTLQKDGPRAVDAATIDAPRLGDRRVLDPSIPFSVHTVEGEPLTIRSA